MFVDLEKGRKDVVGDLEEAKREAREAVDEVMRVRAILEKEGREMKDLLDLLSNIAGPEYHPKCD